jgi:hypothetical protein
MSRLARLPARFAELEEFLDHWDVPTSHERWIRRSATPYPQIVRFYEAMFARAEEATTYVEQFPLQHLPADAERLFHLLLALAQAAIGVELHSASRVPDSPFPHTLRIEKGVQPYG